MIALITNYELRIYGVSLLLKIYIEKNTLQNPEKTWT